MNKEKYFPKTFHSACKNPGNGAVLLAHIRLQRASRPPKVAGSDIGDLPPPQCQEYIPGHETSGMKQTQCCASPVSGQRWSNPRPPWDLPCWPCGTQRRPGVEAL